MNGQLNPKSLGLNKKKHSRQPAVVGKHSSHFLFIHLFFIFFKTLQPHSAALCHHKGKSLNVTPPRKERLISLKTSFLISSLLTLVSLRLIRKGRKWGKRGCNLRDLRCTQGCPNHIHTVTHSHLNAVQYNYSPNCSHYYEQLGALLRGPQWWNMGGQFPSLSPLFVN